MRITITANDFEEAQFGLETLRQLSEGKVANKSVVVKTINGAPDFSNISVVNASPQGNYSAKVNQK